MLTAASHELCVVCDVVNIQTNPGVESRRERARRSRTGALLRDTELLGAAVLARAFVRTDVCFSRRMTPRMALVPLGQGPFSLDDGLLVEGAGEISARVGEAAG